jgi:hypothetical protein
MVSAFNIPDLFSMDLPEPNKGVAKLVLGGTGKDHDTSSKCSPSLLALVHVPTTGQARPSDLNWTPIKQESYYVVDLKQIDVAGTAIDYDPADMGQVIVDR